jgi:GGDEF domain-containing protein
VGAELLAIFLGDGGMSDELLQKADAAMYAAKDAGGNAFRKHLPE